MESKLIYPLVSIITVVYNAEKSIEETIKSVINLDFPAIEYIVIDGGSKDNTLSIIEKYKDHVSLLVSEPDLGIYDAMNKAIKFVTGEWIIYMNSGDTFYSNDTLKRIFGSQIYESFYFIYGNAIVKEDGRRVIPPVGIDKKYFFYNTICHQSIFIKKNVFELIGYHDINYKILADRDLLLRAAINNLKFKYYNIDICVWEYAGFSLMNDHLIKLEERNLREKYFNKFDIIKYKLEHFFLVMISKLIKISNLIS